MEIQFHGAARTVTGSMHLLTVNGKRILLDCGMFQGRRRESYERNRKLPFSVPDLHNVVLSHCHIDHAGNLPQLARLGFCGQVFCTPPTRGLANYMLRDSAMIQERDAEYLNRRRKKEARRERRRARHSGVSRRSQAVLERPRVKAAEPVYTMEDAEAILTQFEDVPYNTSFPVGKGVRATFFDAGHVLGSATILLEIEEKGRTLRLAFSGDLGRKDVPILRDPEPIPEVDALIIESTYGNKLHPPAENLKEEFLKVIQRTVARGGRVVIPAFSVGRTQRVVYFLHLLEMENRLPPIPVFVDSPLSARATSVYRQNMQVYDEQTMRHFGLGVDPFDFPRLRYVESSDESKALNERAEPCVIISASGMCEQGRILHHLKHSVENPRNTVMIVGYQAEHTLGRKLVEGAEEIKIYGQIHKRKCEVVVFNGLSGHADRDGLLDWVRALGRKPSQTFVVHGDEPRAFAFKAALEDEGLKNVAVPVQGEKFKL